jgi:hypothetical protein
MVNSGISGAQQKCELAEFYGATCEAVVADDCAMGEQLYHTCLGTFTPLSVPPGTAYVEFRLLEQGGRTGMDCLWVNPYVDFSCTPNVTNARPAAMGGACEQGSTIPNGGQCKPMCDVSYEPVYAPSHDNAGLPYMGSTVCSWRNLTNPFTCKYVPPPVIECIDPAVVDCMNDRVKGILGQADNANVLWPKCRKPYEKQYLDIVGESYLPENAFSLAAGQISSYVGGERIPLNLSMAEGFHNSIARVGPTWSDPELRAVMFTIFAYSPTMHGLFVYTMLVEYSVAGNMLATVKHIVVDLRTPSSLEVLVYVLVIVLSFGVFCLELRRIFKPEFEDEKEQCNSWTIVFLVLPIEFITSFALRSIRGGNDPSMNLNSIILDGNKGLVKDEDYKVLHGLFVYDYYWKMVNLICLITLNMMFFRYLLTYFPQMLYLTQCVQKIVKPLFTTILLTGIAFGCLGIWFYSMYGQFLFEFRDPMATMMQTAHFAQGGFQDWMTLYWYYPHLWRALVSLSFIVFSLIMRNLPIAVLVSHRKEMCLRENYSYHPFWTGQANVPDKNGRVTFNPARGGWRWDKKEAPKEPPKDDVRLLKIAQGIDPNKKT